MNKVNSKKEPSRYSLRTVLNIIMDKITLNISGMHCASCAGNIEGALKKTLGIKSARVNFALEKTEIEFDPQRLRPKDIIAAIEKCGYKAFMPGEGLDRESQSRNKEVKSLKVRFILAALLSGILMYVAMGHCLGLCLARCISENSPFIQFILASGVLIAGGQFFSRGIRAVFGNRMASMDTLVAIGVGSAYLYSVFVSLSIWRGSPAFGSGDLYYEVAAFLVTFILLGKYLEAVTKRKTSRAIRRLWGLRPKTAVVIQQGREIKVAVEDLRVGDLIAVKPGERIAVDGEIVDGYSGVDESLITGESIPVEKAAGDKVIAGSINKHGAFTFRAQKVGRQTTLAQIIRLVEEAQMSKAPIQELADKAASIFIPVVLIIAFASFFFWILAGKSFIFALTVFITVLIIACPCSLGLAVPTAVVAGTGRAAECGIIIKNAKSLQIARQITTIIFDKTGTLTQGKPKVTDVLGRAQAEDEILRLCASLEKKSEHPLAEAVVEAACAKKIVPAEVESFEAIPGKGLRGKVSGESLLLGNRRLMEEGGVDLRPIDEDIKRLEAEGKTVIFLSKDGNLAGLVAIRDTLKEFARVAIAALKKMDKRVIMLTGDNQRTARAIAGELGITEVLAEVLPKDKQDEIKKLQSAGNKVAFVGDGINDAPALTQADLGIAIGSATDVAIESGDIILIKDDLRDVLSALDISDYLSRKIKQNLFFSFFYNSFSIPIAAGMFYPFTGFLLSPLIAGAAMALSSLSVVINSLLVYRYRKNT